jgi:putative membrane protein
MKKASQLFSADDRKRIAQAVSDAEAKTCAEIVPVVATCSGRYDRSEDVVGLWIGAIALVVVWVLFQDAHTGEWGETKLVISLPIVLAILVGGWLLGVLIANAVPWLRRLFTPNREMREDVDKAARSAFFDSRVHHTDGSTGVLIYVSLFEHIATIVADQQVLEKVGQEKLNELCETLTAGLHEREYAGAFCETISALGAALGNVLPRQEGDKNELADALVTID